MTHVFSHFLGGRLMARVLRGSAFIVLGYGTSQALRLAANLILTRLLFPEAFGLMALVSVVTVGLAMFSDVGIGPAIAQNRRGDDPDFLNTAWTIQVTRGFALWACAAALAWPMATLYDEPLLAAYLPLAGVALAIGGFNPTRIETAHRHLLMGRLTALDLASQAIGIAAMIVLAWATGSVIALVIGGIIGAAAKLVLTAIGLPGPANRFRFEKAAAGELISFGKWIFLSTAFWFVSSQGDKAILGKFLSLEGLGIYNIGYFLASFPLLLGQAVTGRILIPIYRETGTTPDAASQRKIKVMRYGLTAGIIGLLAVMCFGGPWLVHLLYDPRYANASGIVVLVAAMMLPQVIGLSYDQAALAAGDSRRFFVFSALRALAQIGGLLGGFAIADLPGALIGVGIAGVAVHPLLIWIARVHGVWDMRHDLLAGLTAALIGGLAIWMHWDAIAAISG